jgi:hypothetical protein
MIKTWMMGLSLSLFSFLCVSNAQAAADCKKHPKEEWIKEADMKKRLETEGYKIKKFKVDGNCYEIYGWDKNGKRVEIYFDTKDGSIVKSES